MSRGFRCIGTWLTVSAGCAAVVTLLAADVLLLGSRETWQAGFDTALARVCAALVVGCTAWFWCVTTVTAGQVLRGVSPAAFAARGGATRRLALALCGAAVATGLAAPATAADPGSGPGDDPGGVPSLAGLSVPDRTVAGDVRRDHGRRTRPLARPGFHESHLPAADDHAGGVVVRPGDSLWSIAEDTVGAEARVADLVDHWHRTYAANRQVVGADPDLIHPGQRLVLPPAGPTREPARDRDREEQR